jgi:hypothetical protein
VFAFAVGSKLCAPLSLTSSVCSNSIMRARFLMTDTSINDKVDNPFIGLQEEFFLTNNSSQVSSRASWTQVTMLLVHRSSPAKASFLCIQSKSRISPHNKTSICGKWKLATGHTLSLADFPRFPLSLCLAIAQMSKVSRYVRFSSKVEL